MVNQHECFSRHLTSRSQVSEAVLVANCEFLVCSKRLLLKGSQPTPMFGGTFIGPFTFIELREVAARNTFDFRRQTHAECAFIKYLRSVRFACFLA